MSPAAHKAWSASASDRHWACPGSLVFTLQAEETAPSEAAEWGTAAHALAEQCLREGTDANVYQGDLIEGATRVFVVDEEMVDIVTPYVDYVRSLKERSPVMAYEALMAVGRFGESQTGSYTLDLPFATGGTADAIASGGADRTIHIIDLKTGRWPVPAEWNKQMLTYALGFVTDNSSAWDDDRYAKHIKLTIVQPRVSREPVSWACTTDDLARWARRLEAAQWRAAEAKEFYDAHGVTAQWVTRHLQAGDHCKFCSFAAQCPRPLLEIELALRFSGVGDVDVARLSPADVGYVLGLQKTVTDWADAVRAHWTQEAEHGAVIPGYTLSKTKPRTVWRKEKLPDVMRFVLASGLALDEVATPRTPKQISMLCQKACIDDSPLSGCTTQGTPESVLVPIKTLETE